MDAPTTEVKWHLHLDRRTARCVLDRGDELPLIGLYFATWDRGHEILRLHLSAPAVTLKPTPAGAS